MNMSLTCFVSWLPFQKLNFSPTQVMASGRSARLPPTPQTVQLNTSTNIRHVEAPINTNSVPYSTSNNVPISENNLNPFSNDFAAATSQVLDSLSERERQMIINVLKRDDSVRQRDAARIM